MKKDEMISPRALSGQQRSHVLLVLSHPEAGRESAFLHWYRGACRKVVAEHANVLSARHYEQHEVDISQGRFAPLPFRYLALYELSLDGAHEASNLIERVETLHRQQDAAGPPATWLYYPVSEKVGRSPAALPSMLTLAFANAVPGEEAAFREWYATRHIRHALNIPALTSGQCFARTLFQRPGALQPRFSMIALYEQEDTPEAIVSSLTSLPSGTLDFPMLDQDPARFAEWVYRPV
jgi:hypothetical protein